MRKWVYLFLLVLSFPFFQVAKAQNISNEGTDFWAVFPTHDAANDNKNSLANISIFVTSKSFAKVTVSCGGFSLEKDVPANTSVEFNVPRDSAYINSTQGNNVLRNKGIHIVVADGITKVAAYAHIYAGKRSAASLILPFEAIGQRYYSMNYIEDKDGRNYIALVAVEPNTKVLIHTSSKVETVLLERVGDVYEYIVDPRIDITGTYVEVDPISSTCKKFAMFSGNTSVKIGSCEAINSRDPLYQQLYPVNSWGKNYGIVPFKDRNHIIRVLAQEDETSVSFNGTTTVLKKGEFFTSAELTNAAFVSSNKNISVAQYALSYKCMGKDDTLGDPDMVLLNPVEFNINQITLFSSNKQKIEEKYINVCMKTAGTGSFRVNGVTPTESWAVIPANPIYSFIQIQVFKESLTLTADIGFNAVAYGFGGAESYAYSAGTSLANNNYLVVTDATDVAGKEKSDACLNVASNFKIQLPYMVGRIVWTIDAQPSFIDNSPVAVTIEKNGEVFYEYTYVKNEVYTVSGTHKMQVLVDFLPSLGNCFTGSQTYNFKFNADALATADASFDKVVCADYSIKFTDMSKSNAAGKLVTSWHWDFGDGSVDSLSSEQNPNHTYQKSGSFKVKLSVAVENGCNSEVEEFDINVLPKITAKFADVGMLCLNKDFVVEDKSEIENGASIVKWIWDFGDGTTEVPHLNKELFTHKYSDTGSYYIKLIAVADNGCQSLPYVKKVKVYGLPKPDFKIPQACQSDVVIFENTSTEADGATAPLSYLWNFDAGNPNAVNNTSILREGSYTYARADNYTVTLTVTNSFGCSNVISHDITINGASPIADFELKSDRNQLCSSKPVKVVNKSIVGFGKITRLEWYPDFDNQPLWVIVDDNPVYGKPQEIKYDVFDSPATKTYNVKVKAFSGSITGSCYSLSDVPPITVLAAPILDFKDMQQICVNAGRFQLTQASERINLPGKGVYSGAGVINVGNNAFYFDPAVAGVNSHDITYTFTADNGCPESKVNTIIVTPKPTVTVDQDIYVLAGGYKTIETESTGAISYKWVPSEGLNRDDVQNPIVTPLKDTKYTVTVTSAQRCFETKTVYVHVLSSIEVANTFSPNGDGVNDFWNIKYIETYPNATVEIFDRYGAKVFFSRGYSVPFDGNFKNQPLPVGTYYYIIDPKNGKQRKSGSLTLIR